jgi:hypothetical protein
MFLAYALHLILKKYDKYYDMEINENLVLKFT